MILTVCPNPSVDIFVWIDAIHAGQVNRAKEEKHFPGGKGIHVALACAELGEKVTLLGFWGGPTGEWIRSECLRQGIRSIGVDVNEWSRTCHSFKSENEYDETEILGVGPTITAHQQNNFNRLLWQFLPTLSCISMCGSWPEGASGDGYATLIKLSNERDVPVFLDCTGIQLENALDTSPYSIHLNTDEATVIFGQMSIEKLTKELAKHCSLAAVTTGRDGLYLSDGRQMVHANVHIDNCFSAVGSGDCLVAGLMIAYLKKMELVDSARFGVACGAANCLRKDLGMLYKADVDILFDNVKIKKYQI